MKKRSVGLSTRNQLFIILLLSALALMAAFRVLAAPSEFPLEAPPAALYAVSWRTTVITQMTNATAVTTQNYAYQDVTCSFDFADTQVVTVSLQASNDNSGWFETHAFTAVSTDTLDTTAIISRTVSYCRYERMHFEVESNASVTPTCKSVFFNNWSPPAYAEPMLGSR